MECGRTEAILQSDNEPAIILLLQKVVSEMGLLRLQDAPQYSSPSAGSVERFHASLQAQIRTLVSDVEERFDYKADATSPI
eukprot:9813391-Alexandrium_andersonii.AAC.1